MENRREERRGPTFSPMVTQAFESRSLGGLENHEEIRFNHI